MSKNSSHNSHDSRQLLAIIDYGSGNLRSAAKAFEKIICDEALSIEVLITSRAEDILRADHIVLPGQGAFGDCMAGLRGIQGMIPALEQAVITQGKPFLGICVGMQLLAARGLEGGTYEGLGWIAGDVELIHPNDSDDGLPLKIPHMGWNTLSLDTLDTSHPVLVGITADTHFYFVHSYAFKPYEDTQNCVLAACEYGGTIPAIIGRDNIIGTQFHPEKSHDAGLALLRNFLHWSP
jgi:glutamine amidotransferase